MARANEHGAQYADDDSHVLIGVIADEDTTLGFLLAGIGEAISLSRWNCNYLIVDDDTCLNDLEQYFAAMFRSPTIGVILVGVDLWNYVLPISLKYAKKSTAMLLKIPTKSSKTRPIRLKPCDHTAKGHHEHRDSQ